MTTLTKLGIQGIRSFSNERMESLEFEKPVTLIVGHNGAGKTTIIECLKMSTCGQLPPNCDKGHGFVHDPNVAGIPEVKGQIRLLFRTGVSHQHVCATRTFQLTNTRTKAGIKVQFKALENLLRIKDRNGGEDNSNSKRCIDMDTAVPNLMGVSRAILEHVIFCHQEDSNWPLGERILLKKRFDEIFGSSRYTKALEAIEKRRKETAKEGKDKSHVVELVKKDLDASVSLKKDSEKTKADSREKIVLLNQINAEISTLKARGISVVSSDAAAQLAIVQDQLEQHVIQTSGLSEQLDFSLKSRNELTSRILKIQKNSNVLLDSKLSDLTTILADSAITFFFDYPVAESIGKLEAILHGKLEEKLVVEKTQNEAIFSVQKKIEESNSKLIDLKSAEFARVQELSKLKAAQLANKENDHEDMDRKICGFFVKKEISNLVSNDFPFEESIEAIQASLATKRDMYATQSGELWTAKSALKIYSQMKQKSVGEEKCQFCRQSISDLDQFANGIDRMTNKLGEIVSTLSAPVNVTEALRETEKQLGTMRGFVTLSARFPSFEKGENFASFSSKPDQRQVAERIVQLERSDYGRVICDLESRLGQFKNELKRLQESTNLKKIEAEIATMRMNFHQIFVLANQITELKEAAHNTDEVFADKLFAELKKEEESVADEIEKILKLQKSSETDRKTLVEKIQLAEGQVALANLLQRKSDLNVNDDLSEIPEKLREISAKIVSARDARASLMGQQTQLKLQFGEIQKKLNNYLNIEERYRQAMIQAETTALVLTDIARYHQALDRALMAYHVGKMNQINAVIRQLWQRVYRGTDIDFIAIRSDGEDESTNTTRSYNYRVVMVKNQIELEMRGRCSAGQKVLASLIIRLSLSESFGLNCGIISLDEPTTNLDRSNISGLAEALAELIESRRCQQNFQLIIITHDEAFVRMLGRLQACENYYRVAKDDFGHSTISRSAIYEL